MKLSANSLKIIAVIAMVIDHTAYVFVPPDSLIYFIMRIIGRLTCPIMCFGLVEGFFHTHNKRKYIGRMAVFAVISQPFYSLIIPGNLNVLYTFTVALIMLSILENKRFKGFVRVVLVGACFALSLLGDWDITLLMLCCIFRCFRGDFENLAAAFTSCTVIVIIFQLAIFGSAFFIQFGVLLSLIPLSLYSGKRGNNGKNKAFPKWFFYGFYPIHFILLYAIKIFFGG
ncbi:MAG: conjugal transfer protein TraX [Oscillospiraceae bacterium]|nr:conjugal transfer protein TraX [Oscillospiraceae bacterium]